MLPPKTTLHPGCKVNIYLDILGRRDNGYHELLTLFFPLQVPHDTIVIQPGSPGTGFCLECRGLKVDAEENILFRAYRAFSQATGVAPDLDLGLTKRIPMGAGLGGGSSDAAALLGYLNRFCLPSPLDETQLRTIAASVGADVPFFLLNRPAWATGIGDVLRPVKVDLAGLFGLLVCPDTTVSTAWAYQAWDSLAWDGTAQTTDPRPGHFCSHHFFSEKAAGLPCLGRLETPSPASDHQGVALEKQELAPVTLGNALMNDAWFGQTVDPSQTGQTSLKHYRWLRENTNALAPRHGLLTVSGLKVIDAACPNVFFYNSFESVVFPAYPSLGNIKENLLAQGAAGAVLSGSGAGIFAVFRDSQSLEAASQWLERNGLDHYTHSFSDNGHDTSDWGVAKR